MRAETFPLFPGAAGSENPFGLADYFLVELPGSRADVGPLGHELAYRLGEDDEVAAAYYEGAAGYYVALGSIRAVDATGRSELGSLGGWDPARAGWRREHNHRAS